MVTPDMFTFDHLKEIEDAGMFSGVVLIKNVKAESLMGEKGDRDRHAPSAGFSSDAKCPNAPSSGYKVYPLTPLTTHGANRTRTNNLTFCRQCLLSKLSFLVFVYPSSHVSDDHFRNCREKVNSTVSVRTPSLVEIANLKQCVSDPTWRSLVRRMWREKCLEPRWFRHWETWVALSHYLHHRCKHD